jgi:hypothetical protein
MSHHLPEYFIESDVGGFFIVDEYGEQVDCGASFRSRKDAEDAVRALIAEDLANYDGPLDNGYAGGRATASSPSMPTTHFSMRGRS